MDLNSFSFKSTMFSLNVNKIIYRIERIFGASTLYLALQYMLWSFIMEGQDLSFFPKITVLEREAE